MGEEIMCAIPASEEFSTDLSYTLFTYVTLFGESIFISTNSLKFFDIPIIFYWILWSSYHQLSHTNKTFYSSQKYNKFPVTLDNSSQNSAQTKAPKSVRGLGAQSTIAQHFSYEQNNTSSQKMSLWVFLLEDSALPEPPCASG